MEKDNFYGIASFLVMAIPILVNFENIDDILERIIKIRKQPNELKPELASDLVADIVKKSTRSFMESLNTSLANGVGEVSDVRE